MASVNKIKELAQNQQYEMAVDILDSQDLEKSLNPQFIRTCGEVYENVGRLTDARRLYIKAHNMAPESNRIIFSIVLYYLKRGYFTLAKQYANQYTFNDKSEQASYNMNYLIDKASGVSGKELLPRIYPVYMHEMDEFWSYELYLLAKLLGKTDVSDNISSDYRATYRNTIFSNNIKLVDNGFKNAEEYFYTFPKTEQPDSSEEEEELRQTEKKQLDTDYRRMHPEEFESQEAVFLTMEDYDPEADAKQVEEEINSRKKGLFGKLFKKDKKKVKTDSEGEENTEATPEEGEKTEEDNASAESEATEGAENENSVSESDTSESSVNDSTAETSNGETEEVKSEDSDEAEDDSAEEENSTFDSERSFNVMSVEDAITYDYDDGFAPESEMISDLDDDSTETDYFDNASLFEYDDTEEEPQAVEELEVEEELEPEPEVVEEVEEESEPEPEVVEEVEEEPEEEPELEPEVVEEEPEEESEPEPEVVEEEGEPEPEPEVVEEVEEEPEEEPEPEPEVVEEVEEEPEEEPEPEPEVVEEESEVVDEEPAEEVVSEAISDEEDQLIGEPVEPEQFEEYVQHAGWEEVAEEPEAFEETETVEEESEPEVVEEEPEPEVVEEEPEPEVIEEEPEVVEEPVENKEPDSKFRFHEYESDEVRQKYETYKDIDYKVDTSDVRFELPEFKSSLFEGRDTYVRSDAERTADKGIKTEKIEELDTKLKEEERLQREAEELLKSLGIDI